MSQRYYLIGTDTNVGKTAVACALLQSGGMQGLAIIPFKPAASGPKGPGSDPARLLRNSHLLSADDRRDLAPLRYTQSLAPGIADDPNPFLGTGPATSDPDAMIGRARWALARLEQRYDARISMIEGAGGLLVPMPGGTWQDRWIEALDATPLIVSRAGLGGINHCLLTIEALRVRGHEPMGFFTCQIRDFPDPSREQNRTIIEQKSGVPCLGALPYLGTTPRPPNTTDWHRPDLWPTLLKGPPPG